ncbi:MAG: hypothetical protein OEZ36_13945, partial [Spirochaetota bacterium]|nr:hypothetical protein [Spirochaetota bacterium]
LIGNMRFYGGFSLGILLDVFFERTFQGYKTDPNGNTYKDYDYKAPEFGFVNFKGMVGLEYYASRHVGFFLEFGGTTLFGGKDSPVSKRYDTKGLYSSVGTRFYFW